MWSEYNLLVYMLVFDAVMGITVPLEFVLHEIRYRRELRERAMSGDTEPAPQRPSLRWPLVVVLCAGLTSTFAFVIYMQRPNEAAPPPAPSIIPSQALADATAPIRAQLDAAIQERDKAMRERDSALHPPDMRRDPLDSTEAKWALAMNLHTQVSRGVIPKCKIYIARYPTPFAGHFYDDLTLVLDVMNWDHEDSFAQSGVFPGLSVIGLAPFGRPSQANSHNCAETIANHIRVAGSWRNSFTQANDAPRDSPIADVLSKCGDCIQINIGDDPNQ